MCNKELLIVGIILAGGAGRRLNGADKGLQVYRGKRLIEHTIARLMPQVDELVICANRNLEEYRALNFQVIPDQDVNYQGPMAGISTALEHLERSDFEAALVASCDVPKLPNDLRKKLEFERSHASSVAVAHDGERRQNLHCLIERGAWASLIESYASGERAMHRWFAKVGIEEIDFHSQADNFLNINSAELLSQQ